MGSDGYYHETYNPHRVAVSDYLVARSGIGGEHEVNMVNTGSPGRTATSRCQ